MPKQMRSSYITDLDSILEKGDIESVAQALLDLHKKYEGTYKKIYIESYDNCRDCEVEDCSGFCSSKTWNIMGAREETDEQMERRENLENKTKEFKEKHGL